MTTSPAATQSLAPNGPPCEDAGGMTKPGVKAIAWMATAGLAYGAMGIIYGDIGTSPLYTYASIFANVESLDQDDVKMGVSLIFWALTVVVMIKYVLVVLRADDHGEGGTFALYTRLCRTLGTSAFGTLQTPERTELQRLSRRTMHTRPAESFGRTYVSTNILRMSQKKQGTTGQVPEGGAPHKPNWWNKASVPAEPVIAFFQRSLIAQRVLLCITILATAMMFGDGVLTPAVSVVSAVSGLKEAFPDTVTTDVIVGVSCAILIVLFAFQYRGTSGVALAFSPVVILWLGSNAAIGIWAMATNGPEILQGLSPYWIVRFFSKYGTQGWEMLGAVMLAVTGSEAMFADLGHFNYNAVVSSWAVYVYPCLILTYLGQGAHLLEHLDDIGTTYWSTVPNSVFWPMLILATLASVVASQALISACFSICKQAKSLGFFPKVKIAHTSASEGGQIYVPFANWVLMVLTIAVIAGFNADSVKLGQAYGLNISAVMLFTTLLVTLIMIVDWQLSFVLVVAFFAIFGLVDGAFLSANATKVVSGAWVALAITCGFALYITIWWAGQHKRLSALARQGQLDDGRLFAFTTAGAMVPPKLSSAQQPIDEAGGVARGSLDSEHSAANEHAMEQQGNAIDLGLLRGELRLALAKTPNKPLAILPGFGLFYSDNADTVPAVLHHFLRNIEAIHQVNIFVCVRYLPVPFIPSEDRLLVRALPQLPNFYSAVARYGYMETVDHGQSFVNGLITALARLLGGMEISTSHIMQALNDDVPVGPTMEGVMDVSSPAGVYASPFNTAAAQEAMATTGEIEIAVMSNPVAPVQRTASLQVPYMEGRMSVDLATLSHSIEASKLGRDISRRLDTKSTNPHQRLEAIVDVVRRADSNTFSGKQEEASLRVVALVDAAKDGVVYYFGRTCLKMKPKSSFLHDVLYDHLYKPMLLLSSAENEAWQVPVNNLVELGMVLHI